MAVTIGTVMRSCRNHFARGYRDGTFSISGGVLSPAPFSPYVMIDGSTQHDGVWAVVGGVLENAYTLPDEDFEGRVWALYPSREFVTLCEEIAAYDEKNPAGALRSESFGAYSYTRGAAVNGASVGWEEAFAKRLIPYRRMFSEV